MVRGAQVGAVLGLCLAACGGPAREPRLPAAPPSEAAPPRAEPAPIPVPEPVTQTPPPATPDAGSPQTSTPGPLPTLPDGGVLQIPSDTGTASCVPEVEVAEALPEPEGGWDAAASPLPAYREPEDVAPFGLLEPLACMEDARPPLDSWCERTLYNWNGEALEHERRSATGSTRVQSGGCGSPSGCARPAGQQEYDAQGRPLQRTFWDWYRDSRVYEAWEWAPDGRLSAFLEDSTRYGGHAFTLWRLRRACDGRPAHYEITHPGSALQTGTGLAPFTYDAAGRLTYDFVPGHSTARAWDAAGRLRAEEHTHSTPGTALSLRSYFDAEGQELARLRTYSGNMGTSETWTWNERGPDGRVQATRELWRYDMEASTLTRLAYDAEGRKVLAWATSTHEGPESRRRAYRWTYACATSEPVRYEEDRGGNGTVESVKTWSWDPEAQHITERDGTSGPYTVYRYRCEP